MPYFLANFNLEQILEVFISSASSNGNKNIWSKSDLENIYETYRKF